MIVKILFNKFSFGIKHLIEIYNYFELLSYSKVLAIGDKFILSSKNYNIIKIIYSID